MRGTGTEHGTTIKIKTNVKKEAIFFFFLFSEENGACLSCPAGTACNSSTGKHVVCTTPHKVYQSEWTIQHMLSAVITSHASTTNWTTFMTKLSSVLQKQQRWHHSWVYTTGYRLPYSYWSNSCQSGTPYVIYTLYINIFQRQKQVVCCWFGLNKWETSIHLSKEYTIRRRGLLCTFSLAAKCSRKRLQAFKNILCDNRDRVYMNTRRKRVTRGHTELSPWQRHASCTWESCFDSTTLDEWDREEVSMYKSGPHRQRWQTYFRMIFSFWMC